MSTDLQANYDKIYINGAWTASTASETIEQRLIEITPTRKDQTAKQKRELPAFLAPYETGERFTGEPSRCTPTAPVMPGS